MDIGKQARSLWDDLLWPMSYYLNVRDFVSRMAPAALTITLMGFILSDLGISPGISGAVGMLGLAVSTSEVFLRVLYNLGEDDDPLNHLGAGKRVSGFVIYLVVGFALFVFLGSGSISALKPSLYQYVIGIFVTGATGAVFMRTYTNMKSDGVQSRIRILASSGLSLGFIVALFLVLPELLSAFNYGSVVDLIEQQPKNLTNTSLTMSDIEIGG